MPELGTSYPGVKFANVFDVLQRERLSSRFGECRILVIIDNTPACLRQKARKGTGHNSVHDPLRAGFLLFGASFFSYRDSEFGFRHVDHLIVGFGLDLSTKKLSLKFFDSRLKPGNLVIL